tara:strand:+ start:100 stop:555 length:456 start_codon:yes stop_codon:yes gene_type:complete
MSSGKEHDKSIKRLSIPIAVLISIIVNLKIGILFGAAFLIGGLWLSPDLDTMSRPLKRWGLLQILWWPYRKTIKHRSFLSHSPLIGTAIRFFYLLSLFILIILMLNNISNQKLTLINSFSDLINQYPQEILALFLGVESSALLHYIQDKVC